MTLDPNGDALSPDAAATDIAVVGMAARLPGARHVGEFWNNLRQGVESIADLTEEQLEGAGIDRSLLRNPHYVRRSPILDDLEGFDAGFFGFSPRDAAIMDPQHRHFLEVSWEALEHAGHPPERFAGAIGVFAGCGMNAYMMYNLLPNQQLMRSVGLFLVRHTGNDKDFLATRVSYSFDLKGPSINVQTACSTSLVAVHLAVQSLLAGECDMALAGGVTIELPHRVGYLYQEGEILSRDGHCRPFDADSTGTLFGSGAGCVVLRRLQDAIDDGDQILAIVKGTAINNDGASKVGYLAPSVDGQAHVITEALAMANVSADDISYVETHGTGTAVGDPIEVTALAQAFRGSERRGYCGLGSVKSNIGHLDTAAGIASLIKVVQALRHRELPPSLHFSRPNPLIDFDASPFYVNASLRPWEVNGKPRRAGVSSLGVGGTNAHLILEEAPSARVLERVRAQNDSGPTQAAAPRNWQLLVLSARTPAALDRATDDLLAHLEHHPDLRLADVTHTSQIGRRAFACRRAVACESIEDARTALAARDAKRVFTSRTGEATPSIVFLFPGGGAQYPNMGRDLYDEYDVFRQEVDRCLELLRRHTTDDIRAALFPAGDDQLTAAAAAFERPSIGLPALFTVSYALAKLWSSWGIEPAALAGHSMGEYVAACLAGVMSLDAALLLVTVRGQLFERLPEGGMLSVPLPEKELQALLPSDLSIAAVNSPSLCVVAGPTSSLAKLERVLSSREIEAQRLRISVAAHSGMLEPILEEFRARVRTIPLKAPDRPFISNVTGTWANPEDVASADYWVTHLRQTVRFSDGVQELLREPNRVFLEVGPGTTLSSLARAHTVKAGVSVSVASLRHPQERVSDAQFLLTTFGRLWLSGVAVDWARLRGDESRVRVSLPTYPFEHERYWIDPVPRVAAAAAETPALTRIADESRWFWRPTWTRREIPRNPTPAADRELAVVFADTRGLGERLAQELKALRITTVIVRAGEDFIKRSATEYVMNPGRREDYDALLQAIAGDSRRPTRIAHLWSLPTRRAPSSRALLDQLDSRLDLSFYSLLFLGQALAGQEGSDPLQVMAVTSGAYRVLDEPVIHPDQATLVGPVRVMARESAQVTSLLVDIEPAEGRLRRLLARSKQVDEAFLAKCLVTELLAVPEADTIAYRGRHRWSQHYGAATLPVVDSHKLRDRGVYLITGGLGAIGLALGEHLARHARARLVLVSRTALPDRSSWPEYTRTHGQSDAVARRIRGVLAIEAAGGEVDLVSCDVGDLAQMRATVEQATARFGAIHGVIHAAGTINDGVIPLKTKESAETVLAPKIQGTLAIDAALHGRTLDFFAVCSSTSAILGPAGQVDYTAANAFLNAFADARASRTGQYTVAINWGLWKDAGMAVESARLLGYVPPPQSERDVAHPLLQHATVEASGDVVFTASYMARQQWVLDEHRLATGQALVPGTGFVEIIRAATSDPSPDGTLVIRDVSFITPLQVADDERRRVRVTVSGTSQARAVTIASQSASSSDHDEWTEHAFASVTIESAASAPAVDLDGLKTRCSRAVDVDRPSTLRTVTHQERQLLFGPRWRNVTAVRFGLGEAIAELELAGAFESELDAFGLHPALLDIATGFALPLLHGYEERDDFYVPLSYRTVRVFDRLPRRIVSYARLANPDDREVAVFDFTLTDPSGRPLVEIEQFVMRRIADPSALQLPARGSQRVAESHARETGRAPLPELLEAGMVHGIAPAEGAEAFLRILSHGIAPQVVASSLDLDVLASHVKTATFEDEDSTGSLPKQARPTTGEEYVAPRSDLERQIATAWQEILGIDQVGIRDNFFDLGGHSLLAVRLFNRLKKLAGQSLPLSTLFEAPTIEKLAALLGQEEPQSSFTSLVPIKPSGSLPPFFCIHGMGGNILEYLYLPRYLHADQPFYGLQARGLDGNETPLTSLEEFAAHYIAVIKTIQPKGPYYLGGSSFGGLVGFEIARQLQERGEEVALLALFDSYGRDYPKPLSAASSFRKKWNYFTLRLAVHTDNLKLLSTRDKIGYAWEKLGILPGRWYRRVMKGVDQLDRRIRLLFLPKELRDQFRLTGEDARGIGKINIPRAIRDVQIGVNQAAKQYELKPYGGPVTLFRASHQPPGIYPDPTNGWKDLAVGGLEVIEVPGYHGAIVREPRVRYLAEKLNPCLERAHAKHGTVRRATESAVAVKQDDERELALPGVR